MSSPLDTASPRAAEHNQLWSAEDDEYDVDENSELNRGNHNGDNGQSHYPRTSNGVDRNGDRGENGHHVQDEDGDIDDEKSFKYYKELPDHTKLYDAKKRSPGFRAIGGGLVLLAGLGYLIAYLCTSVSSHVYACHRLSTHSNGLTDE